MLSNDQRSTLKTAICRLALATQRLIDAREKGATTAAERDCALAQNDIAVARALINLVLAGETRA